MQWGIFTVNNFSIRKRAPKLSIEHNIDRISKDFPNDPISQILQVPALEVSR